MKKHLGVMLFLFAGFLSFPDGASAAPAAAEYRGRILIDASNHGEAWYVNPQTLMRVYLGRPEQGLERFQARAIYVTYSNISRLADASGGTGESRYAEQVSGYVLSPSDLPGAAWYVDPDQKIRRRLATGSDAWEVMKLGMPVGAATLAAIDVEPEPEAGPAGGEVKDIVSADTLSLDDGTTVRLISIEVPSNPELQQAAMARIAEVVKEKPVRLESDVHKADREGRALRYVFAGEVNLNYDLVRNGLAFHNFAEPNYKYAELLIVGAIDAQKQRRGFWNNASNVAATAAQ